MSDDIKISSAISTMSGIVRAFVKHPDEVSVTAISDGASTKLQLRVSPDDLGQVIGRKGQTADSLRTVVAALSKKLAVHLQLDIEDNSV